MIPVADAQAKLLSAVRSVRSETVPIDEAWGRTLDEDVVAKLTQPPFAASAMDGYAIRFADLPGPWRLTGEAAAGGGFAGEVASGEAVRIFTGAPLPAGADTVLIQEDAARDGDTLRLAGDGPPHHGAHVRPAGLDFAAGDRVAPAGTRVGPVLCSVLAAAGHGTVAVRRRPRVVLIATGNELVPPGTAPRPDQIVGSNGVGLAALFRSAGAEVRDAGIVADDLDAIAAAIGAARDADLIVTIGGASVGDHDLVRPALVEAGATIDVWKVAMRPGKPMMFGRLGEAHVLGLPGNPVSAQVCARLFGLPLVRALVGDPSPLPRTTRIETTAPLPANGGRQDYVRAVLSENGVAPQGRQDSSTLLALARAGALIVRPPNAPPVAAGEQVEIIPLDSDSLRS